MKIKRKEIITKRNIATIYGRLNKFFDSIEEGYDYSIKKWNSKKPWNYRHAFFKAKLELKNNKIVFRLPVKTEIRIGDKISITSNRITVQNKLMCFDPYNLKSDKLHPYYNYSVYERIKPEYDYRSERKLI